MCTVVLRIVGFAPQHFNEASYVVSHLIPKSLNCYESFYMKFFHSYPSHMSSFKDIGSYTIPSYFLFSKCRFDTIIPIHQLVILYVRRLKIQVSIKILGI